MAVGCGCRDHRRCPRTRSKPQVFTAVSLEDAQKPGDRRVLRSPLTFFVLLRDQLMSALRFADPFEDVRHRPLMTWPPLPAWKKGTISQPRGCVVEVEAHRVTSFGDQSGV